MACANNSFDEQFINQLNELKVNDDNDDVEEAGVGFVSQSQRLKPKLVYRGFDFKIAFPPKEGKTTWRCCKDRCTSKVITYGNTIDEEYQVHYINGVAPKHEVHPIPDNNKLHQLEHRRNLKTKSTHSDEAPRKIIGISFHSK